MDANVSWDVVSRWRGNPLIRLEDIPFRCSDVWNAGVAFFEDQWYLLVTVESLRGHTEVYLARSPDGRRFEVDTEPFLDPALTGPTSTYEATGVRDARITPMDGHYFIVYVADSPMGLRLGLARTEDFSDVERLGLITQPDTNGGAMFPEMIGGRYALLERPNPGASIWVSYSDDLTFWGDSHCVMTPRGGFWDASRIGPAAPPVRIEQGWLLIYYGQKHTSAGPLVRLGAAILDAEDPSKVVARSNIPVLSPRERYERIGDLPNVVFSCGAMLSDDDEMQIYYGGSDSCICLGTAPLRDIVGICLASKLEF